MMVNKTQEPVWLRVRQGRQDNAFDDAEDRRVRADPQGECTDHDERELRMLQEETLCKSDVIHECDGVGSF